jgi:hypothetical protein
MENCGKIGHNKTFDPFLQTFKDIIKAFFAIYFPLFSLIFPKSGFFALKTLNVG